MHMVSSVASEQLNTTILLLSVCHVGHSLRLSSFVMTDAQPSLVAPSLFLWITCSCTIRHGTCIDG
jgi:hypothetical protein